MARAEYTTGLPCAAAPCNQPTLHHVDYGHGYVHLCDAHAGQTLAALWPAGLPVVRPERPRGVWGDPR
jgi:hypothetical protein